MTWFWLLGQPVSINPGVGNLVLAGRAPLLVLQDIKPGAGSLVITGRAPALGFVPAAPSGQAVVGSITVAGTTVNAKSRALRIRDRVDGRTTAGLTILDPGGSLSIEESQAVVVTATDSTKMFSGFVDTVRARRVNPTGDLEHDIECKGMEWLADKRVVAAVYENQTASFIVSDIISTTLATEGVTAGTIQQGPTISRIPFPRDSATVALDKVAELAGSIWWIDFNRKLHFIKPTTNDSGFTLKPIDFIGVPSISRKNPKYRNKQYVIGKDTTASQTETFEGDNETRAWTTAFPLAKTPTIGVKAIGATSFATRTVGIGNVATGVDFFWNKGSNTFSQATDSVTPVPLTRTATGADVVQIVYQGEFDIVVISEDTAEAAVFASREGSSGLVEQVVRISNMTGQAEGRDHANALLGRWGIRGRTLTGDTLANVRVGQMQKADLPVYNLVSAPMFVESVTLTDRGRGDGQLIKQITISEGARLGKWWDFFRDLRADIALERQENLASTEVVALATSFAESVLVTETVGQIVTTCPFPSATTFPTSTLVPC